REQRGDHAERHRQHHRRDDERGPPLGRPRAHGFCRSTEVTRRTFTRFPFWSRFSSVSWIVKTFPEIEKDSPFSSASPSPLLSAPSCTSPSARRDTRSQSTVSVGLAPP